MATSNNNNKTTSLVNLKDTDRETAKSVYNRLSSDRKVYTTRAETNAQYTIPSLFPKESDSKSTDYKINNQSIGARGVNNLSSKLMLALFPPNSPFFRVTINKETEEELAQVADSGALQELDQQLARYEHSIMQYFETRQIRITVSEAIKQLVVAGNALLFLPPDVGGAKLYKLSSYVLQRDALGNILQIVTVDNLTLATSPPEVQQAIAQGGEQHKPNDPIEIYTHIYLDGDVFLSYQEVDGVIVNGSENKFPKGKLAWIPLRMNKIDGESYGRSYVEEYIGGLKAVDTLRESLMTSASLASFNLFLVNPAGQTQVRRITKAKSGDFVAGRQEDIGTLRLNKQDDMSVVKAVADGIEANLSYIFMLNSAVQRQGERVTAEEIRYVAGELEDTLGGTYSILSQELQLPLIRRLIAQLENTGLLPILPEGTTEPAITTGLEALGRGHDLNKLRMFLEVITAVPESAQRVNWGAFLLSTATGLGINTSGLVKTDAEIAQEQQQAMMAQMAQQAIPNATKGMMDNLNQQQQAPQ